MSGASFLKATGDSIRGMSQIVAYTGYGEKSIVKLVREDGFPAAIIAGAWESNKELIEEWRRGKILAAMRTAASDLEDVT